MVRKSKEEISNIEKVGRREKERNNGSTKEWENDRMRE